MPDIKFIRSNLVKLKVDAIVNAANTGLVGGNGLCGMIHEAAGPGIDVECKKIGYCLRGEAVMTGAYNLPAGHVIHTVGPIYGQHDGRESEILYSCYYESLMLADRHSLNSIAFPYISTGIYGYPMDEARPVAISAIEEFLEDNHDTSVRSIYLVEYDGSID